MRRRPAVVGLGPHGQALGRLVGALRAEQDDEGAVADRREVSLESLRALPPPPSPDLPPDLVPVRG